MESFIVLAFFCANTKKLENKEIFNHLRYDEISQYYTT